MTNSGSIEIKLRAADHGSISGKDAFLFAIASTALVPIQRPI
jgi:hypothetical protein